MMQSNTHVVWVDDLCSGDMVPRAGAKIARLGELRKCGVLVPDGFVVTTDAFSAFMSETGLDAEMRRLFAGCSPSDVEQISHTARDARALVEATPIPASIADEVVEAYEELSYRLRDLNVPVAVRSSATGEDGAEASFAGQFDTFLGVTGNDRLLSAIQRCWGSLFTDRAVDYRCNKGLSHEDSPMAVGVIKLVHARASGVAFSVHPVSGNPHRLVIEGSWGWGEAVVQGLVNPDHIEVGKSDRRVLEYKVSDKQVVSAFDYAQGLVVEHEMPRRLREEHILEDEEIQAIVDSVLAIEKHYGHPVDVEWVIDRHRRPKEPITIVQTRPVTVKAKTEATKTAPAWNPVAYAQKYAFGTK